jgi:hypothetical protein
MPARSKKHAGSKDEATSSVATIDYWELEVFRRSLPEYRQYESYSFFIASWDIVRALYLIHKWPRALQTIDVAQFARQYGFPFIEDGSASDALPEDSGFFYVDTKTVMSEQIDLERSVLLALIEVEGQERPSALLIDGLHRLYKAARLGTPKLRAYVLTPEEERLCRR